MKIDVPSCFAIGWLCALPQDWPSAWGRSPGPSAGDRPTRTFVWTRGRPGMPERRPSDVIFPNDIQCDNPEPNALKDFCGI
jgi:hypothetical protein